MEEEDDVQLAMLIVQVVAGIGVEIAKAVGAGDWSVFDKPVRELIPPELRTTLEKKKADAEVAKKFGPRP